jgi:hypothetical protein
MFVFAFTLLLACGQINPSLDRVDETPTVFDRYVFSGQYYYSGQNTMFSFTGKIAANGRLSALTTAEEGALVPGGGLSTDGSVSATGTITGLMHTFTMNLDGKVTIASDSMTLSGTGTWTGSRTTSTTLQNLSGTWVIDGGKFVGTNNNAPPSNYLCWTGSNDSLRSFKLLRMNGTTGTVSVVGGTGFYTQLVYGPDSTLYGVGSDLAKIDPMTGAEIVVGHFRSIDTIKYALMSGAAFSPSGVLYVSENGGKGRIFSVDTATAIITLVCTPTRTSRDFTFAPWGSIYAISSDLLLLNPADFTVHNIIGPCRGGAGAQFFTAAGVLMNNDCFPSTRLWSVDLLTGTLTQVLTPGSKGVVAMVEEKVPPALARKAFLTNPPMASPPADPVHLANLEAMYRLGRNDLW